MRDAGMPHLEQRVRGGARDRKHHRCAAVGARLDTVEHALHRAAPVRLPVGVMRGVHERRAELLPEQHAAGATLRVDHVRGRAQQDLRVAVELHREVERRAARAAREGNCVLATSGDRVDLHAAPLQCCAHAVDDNALAAERRIVVVAGDGDARHRWHFAQYTVVRPAVTVWFRGRPHVKHGCPPRPYTSRRSWLLPRAFHTSR